MVSLAAADRASLDGELAQILTGCGLKEFKWTDLSSAQHRFAALKMIEWVFPKLVQQTIRIDVLLWDTEDSRHKIRGRDDLANLSRMYYHLLKNVLRSRWPDGSLWVLYPDENSAINWVDLDSFLSSAGMIPEIQPRLLETNKWKVRIKTEFSIYRIVPCRSHEEALVQLADLVVGLAVYSRTKYLPSVVTLKPANGGHGKTGQRRWPETRLFYPAHSPEGKFVFVRQLRGPHLST